MGSASGSIWSTIFVYNGIGRLTSSSTRTAADRLSPPGVTRLLSGGPLHLNLLIGYMLVAALAVALVACALGLRRGSLAAGGRLPLALAAALATWLVLGVAVLSSMRHMPVRYLEPLAPAIAAALGISVTYVTRRAVRGLAVPAALAATLVLLAVLVSPTSESFALVRGHTSDGGSLGAMPSSTVSALSRYLTAHRGSARYEFAVSEADLAAPLIVADHQPVLVLASTPYHPLVSPAALSRAVQAGQVRYVLLSRTPIGHSPHAFTPRTVREQIPAWVISHGTDVTRQAGLGGYGMLYRV
jgi:hypothetical protein